MPERTARRIRLHQVAHGRTGDKGDRANVSLIAYSPEWYPVLADQVTAQRVARLLAHRGPVKVARYDLPGLMAFNFVIDHVLEGGVNSSLNLDGHGKALSFLLLSLTIEAPAGLELPRPGFRTGPGDFSGE